MIEEQRSNYVVNTNYKYHPQAHEEMLEHKKVAAYYAPWKYKIANIQKGDRVFLYQSTIGIVAVGTGSGIVHTDMHEGTPEEKYSMDLDSFHLLRTPMTAAEMRKAAQSHLAFVQTVFSLTEAKATNIWCYIKDHCL